MPLDQSPCIWRTVVWDSGSWETACGWTYFSCEGGPLDARMSYCCYCGRLLKEKGPDDAI